MEQEPEIPDTELSAPQPIRVETALSRYPIHRLARKGDIKIEVSEQIARRETAFQWKVSYNSKYGQPGPLAYKLDTLIINRRIEEATRPVPRMIKLGSLHDICRELDMSEGKNVVAIKNALHQNASAYVDAKIRYKLADGSEKTLEAGFTRYSVIFTGEVLPDGRKADGVYIILNDVFIQVINGAMTRPLDYDYLKDLPPAPQRFYELLSYQMYAALKYDRPRAKLTYSEFCIHAPQKRHTEWEKVRSQMTKVHKPHRDSGYIAKIDYQQTVDRQGDPDWIMLYQPGPKARAEFHAFTKRGGPVMLEIAPPESEPAPILSLSETERELIRRGITPEIARELVDDHEEEKILAQIECLDWLARKKPSKIGDPAAYLVSSIQRNYAPPAGFISKAEEERRQEAKKTRERKAAEERRLQDAQRREEKEKLDREKDERKAVEAYWESLSREQQAEIDAKSKAATPSQELEYEKGPLKQTFQWMRRQNYLLPLLKAGGKLPADT